MNKININKKNPTPADLLQARPLIQTTHSKATFIFNREPAPGLMTIPIDQRELTREILDCMANGTISYIHFGADATIMAAFNIMRIQQLGPNGQPTQDQKREMSHRLHSAKKSMQTALNKLNTNRQQGANVVNAQNNLAQAMNAAYVQGQQNAVAVPPAAVQVTYNNARDFLVDDASNNEFREMFVEVYGRGSYLLTYLIT